MEDWRYRIAKKLEISVVLIELSKSI